MHVLCACLHRPAQLLEHRRPVQLLEVTRSVRYVRCDVWCQKLVRRMAAQVLAQVGQGAQGRARVRAAGVRRARVREAGRNRVGCQPIQVAQCGAAHAVARSGQRRQRLIPLQNDAVGGGTHGVEREESCRARERVNKRMRGMRGGGGVKEVGWGGESARLRARATACTRSRTRDMVRTPQGRTLTIVALHRDLPALEGPHCAREHIHGREGVA